MGLDQVGKKVAVGAVWMVALRFLERGIGFISTLVLARLLVPADFGLVAMAMAVFAFVEMAGYFGFDLALLRDKDAPRSAFDSAWTLYVIHGTLAALLLLALAVPAARFFEEPRLTPVMLCLALVAFVQGFDNIGTVYFRKEFRFGAEFRFMLARKLVGFVATVGLALWWQNHWALIGGMAAQRAAATVLSYTMHPYRPRLALGHARALFGFSSWIVGARLLEYMKGRGPDFMIGRWLDSASLGLYKVAREIATLPSTELMVPILRAVFPGYAQHADDRARLAQSFLHTQGTILLCTLPVCVCLMLLAAPVQQALLGSHWAAAVPLIEICALYGAVSLPQLSSYSIFEVLGVPQRLMAVRAIENAVLLPAIGVVLWQGGGLIGVAWCLVAVQLALAPVVAGFIGQLLPVTAAQRWAMLWRPLLGAAVAGMVLHLLQAQRWLDGSSLRAFLVLALGFAVGLLSFLVTVALAWWAVGRPSGAERTVWRMLSERWSKWRAA